MILIASNTFDLPHVQPVVDILKKNNIDVLVYLADKVADGSVRFSYMADRNGAVTCVYGDRHFSPQDVQAAWYRRPDIFGEEAPDKVKAIYLNRQRKDCQDALWYAIPEKRWLNAPLRMQSAQHNKCLQTQLAQQVGFTIPVTVVSNDLPTIFDSVKSEELVLKMLFSTYYDRQKSYVLTTNIIPRSKKEELANTNPFPGVWQEYIAKKQEWRVTVVGRETFAVIVRSHDDKTTRDDWRKYQTDENLITFEEGTLPREVTSKCFKLLRLMGLQYGAFDFIQDPEGNFIFVEVNINGQYQWLVDRLGLSIPQAIADNLMRIAKQ